MYNLILIVQANAFTYAVKIICDPRNYKHLRNICLKFKIGELLLLNVMDTPFKLSTRSKIRNYKMSCFVYTQKDYILL